MSIETQSIAFVFPGQGAQFVGMGQDFATHSKTAAAIFETFDQALQQVDSHYLPVSQVSFNGPDDILKQTLYTQPAILATSLAALALFQERVPHGSTPIVTAGHSLGEYGALVASGVLDVPSAAKLVVKRASLMQEARSGTMSAVLGLPQETLEAIVKELQATHPEQTISVANFNTPDQIVITGSATLLEKAASILKEAGAKRVLPLPVGGAFHSPLMKDSAEAFVAFLTAIAFKKAVIPVVTNVDALATTDADELKMKLGQQIDHSVHWTQTMATMVNDLQINTVIEFGPGKVLSGMFKKTYPEKVTVYNVFDIASLETVCAQFSVAVPAG